MSKSMANEAPAPYGRDRMVTAEEFSRHPEWGRCELKRGRVVPMPPPKPRHGLLVAELVYRLKAFMRTVRIGQIMAESGIRTEREPDTVRGSDISYMSNARFAEAGKAAAYPDIAPELCVEVASPTDSLPKLREKAAEYLAAGVLLVWIVDAERKQVHVFTKLGEPVVLGDTDTLRGGEVLAGFELPLAELFAVLDVN